MPSCCYTHCCRYLFLLYNGTVHYWHVSRPLQRDKMRGHLLATAEKVVQVGG